MIVHFESDDSPPGESHQRQARSILQAMLQLVAERGFHDAPMSLVAKRAGTSAGIIYHYFPSKDELIRALYLHVKAKMGRFLIEGRLLACLRSRPSRGFG